MTRGALGVVAVLVLGSACPSRPQLPPRHRVEVDVLWTRGAGPQVQQGVSRTQVTLEDNDQDRIRIGVFEGISLQAGQMWRTSVWMAAFQASVAANQSLVDWVIAVESDTQGNRIDGPSAGGLLTAAMLAGMTGAQARPEFTMTGTVNPDGSIGPVGGIPQKLRAAVEAGKTVLGFPVGQRHDVDLADGKVVDLRSLFPEGEVTLEEVDDIYEAYELLTGERLSRPEPLAEAEMAPPKEVLEALSRSARDWLASARSNYQTYGKLGVNNDWLDRQWTRVDRAVTEAERLLADGHAPAAYWQAASMFVDADSVLILGRLLGYVNKGNYDGAVGYVDSLAKGVDERLFKVLGRLGKANPRSPNDLMSLIDAFEAFQSGLRSFHLAQVDYDQAIKTIQALFAEVKAGKKTLDEAARTTIVNQLFSPTSSLIVANVNAVVAEHNLGFRPPAPGERAVATRRLEHLAQLMRAAATSNLAFFETTYIGEQARLVKLDLEAAKASFNDTAYQKARVGQGILETLLLPRLPEGSPLRATASLANAFSVYVDAAYLIAKYYSLRFALDQGAVVGVGRKKAFESMLGLAERMAREHAARARAAVGEVPVAACIAYRIARAYENRQDPADRVQALEQFWRASLFSQLAVMFASAPAAR